ncbi:hypothetical protein BML2537_16060 [Providencia stuartii]|nr:hypothetical protein BML2537_16060 [Providencia stuartii]GHB90551.1 hypothetical protein GCM10007290_16070 [Providencia thailandensis]
MKRAAIDANPFEASPVSFDAALIDIPCLAESTDENTFGETMLFPLRNVTFLRCYY